MANIPRPTDNPIKDAHRNNVDRQKANQEDKDSFGISEFFEGEDESLRLQKKQTGTLERLEDIQAKWTETLGDIAENIDNLVTAQNESLKQKEEQTSAQARTERQSSMFGGGDGSEEGGEGIIAGAQNMGGRLMTMIRSVLRLGSMIFLPALGGLMLLMRTLGNEKVQDTIVGIRDLWVNKVMPFLEHMWQFTDDTVKELEAGLDRMQKEFSKDRVIAGIIRIPGMLIDTFLESVGSIINLIGEYFDINWMQRLGGQVQLESGRLTNISIGIVTSIVDFIDDLFNSVFGFVHTMSTAYDKEGMKGLIYALPGAVWQGVKDITASIAGLIDSLFGTSLKETITKEGMLAYLLEVPRVLLSGVGNLVGTITTMIDNLFGTDITASYEDVRQFITKVGNSVLNYFEDTVNNIIDFVKGLGTAFKKEGLMGVINAIPGEVLGFVKDQFKAFTTFIQGLGSTEIGQDLKKWWNENIGFLFDLEWWKEKLKGIVGGALSSIPGVSAVADWWKGDTADPKTPQPNVDLKNSQEERTKNRDKTLSQAQKDSGTVRGHQPGQGSGKQGGGSPTVIDYSSTSISSSSQTAAVATRPSTTPARMRNSVLETP